MKSTTERGLGHRHQMVRRRLLFNHRDGEPCWWCGAAMYKAPDRNFDGAALEADHSRARSVHGAHGNDADRLLHRRCNRQRQAGQRDDERPALTKAPAPRGVRNLFEW